MKGERWQDAVRTLLDLQDEYQGWLDNLPDNLLESALAHKLQAICALDLAELESVEPPPRVRARLSKPAARPLRSSSPDLDLTARAPLRC